MTKGLFKERGAQAAVLSIFEFAAGLAAFATPGMQKAGVMHMLSSAMYATAAAKMGKGSGGKRSAGGAAGFGAAPRGFTPETTKRAPVQLTINLSGPVFADEPEVYAKLDAGLKQHIVPWLVGDGATP